MASPGEVIVHARNYKEEKMEVMRTLDLIVDPSHTALVVIDPQRVFCSPKSALVIKEKHDISRIEATIPRLNRFIDSCRRTGVVVAWARQVFIEEKMLPNLKAFAFDDDGKTWFCREDNPEIDWDEKMERPIEGEIVITKWSFDAFQDTDFHLQLQCRGIKTLLMTGFTSNVCVESTARDGFFKGYYIVMVSDCTNTYTQIEYDSAILNIEKYFGKVAISEEIMNIWKQKNL